MYSPFAIATAWLLALENPLFSVFCIRITSGNLWATKAGLSSCELLSTTMISLYIPFSALATE
jgi:hypothetical protein